MRCSLLQCLVSCTWFLSNSLTWLYCYNVLTGFNNVVERGQHKPIISGIGNTNTTVSQICYLYILSNQERGMQPMTAHLEKGKISLMCRFGLCTALIIFFVWQVSAFKMVRFIQQHLRIRVLMKSYDMLVYLWVIKG